jgi:cell division protein FtsB
MSDKTNRQWLKTITVRVLALTLVLGGVQYVFNTQSRDQYHVLRGELDRMRELNRDLSYENERLQLQIQGIANDDRYLEQVARQEFGMIRRGELLYRFEDDF